MTPALRPLPTAFAATRDSLHAVAEHVIAPVRYLLEGHIGLRPLPYGFGTDMMGIEDRQVRVEHGMLVDSLHGTERRDDLTTLADAAAFLGTHIGAPENVYTPATDGDPQRRLEVDRDAADALAEWFTFGAVVLQQVRNAAGPDDKPSLAQLWPEHFDLALEIGPEDRRVNVGASPGDEGHPEPYLYVGPHGALGDDPVWNESFGASLSYADLLAGADPMAFIATARAAVGR